MKITWAILKDIMNKNKANSVNCDEFIINNSCVKDPESIANSFNNYFTNVGPNLANNIPATDIDPISYLPNSYTKSMFLKPVTSYEVYDVIRNINSNKACGYDEISPKAIKSVADILCTPLCNIFNLSFEQGVFPDLMKIARVIPVFKKGDKHLLSIDWC